MNFWYHLCWWLCRVGLFFWHPVFRVTGRDRVPAGSCIFCANHSGMADPIWILLALSEKRMIRIMAKQQLLKIPVLGAILRGIGVFPVDRGNSDIGTTKRGIGPTYMDKYERCGLRIYDLVHPEIFAEKARATGTLKNKIITAVYGGKAFDLDAVIAEYTEYGKRLAKYVDDVSVLTYEANKAGKTIMFEGAQATLLDIDFGTYPYVTSSNPTAGNASTGSGIGPRYIDHVVGVVKAYTTRVGEGPFVTELLDTDGPGHQIRETGHEYGTVTGRPRRCGWLDAFMLKYSARLNSLDCLAVTRLDILDKMPKIKMCVGYKIDGQEIKQIPASLNVLAKVEPVFEEFEGWLTDITSIRTFDELPVQAKTYLNRLSEVAGVELGIVSVGPEREQTIVLKKLL